MLKSRIQAWPRFSLLPPQIHQNFICTASYIFSELVFPEAYYRKTTTSQGFRNFYVSPSVSIYLSFPKSLIRFGEMSTFGAAMPKASINEHCKFLFREIKVRFTWQLSVMQFPSFNSSSYQRHAQPIFCCSSVFCSNSRHRARTFFRNVIEFALIE
jgi:hypothetical protein